MSTCSTHVLDAARGRPAAGVVVLLTAADGSSERAATDADGRVRFETHLGPGEHRITFATGEWFAAAGRETFYPSVTLDFATDAGQPHYHVALLLSPYSYTTYRGS
ncbi:hydroxyisourate hydrolase [Nocardioides antri]|uniref:5-hydroxyisourate hydrolase n=1 Tax=Nocardioides antri TaxID=2607659 RepID=A0A5B1LZZ9_9ACTN|nr:hydroxyisourate hydrolase [Nocardioides antri]KAA1426026.1 hydroxyisourate hydrolase [Nocardioides antri]